MTQPAGERSLAAADRVTMLLGAVGVGGAALVSLGAVWASGTGDTGCPAGLTHERCAASYVWGGIATAAAAFAAVVVGLLLAQRRIRAGDPRGWTRAAYGILGISLAPLLGWLVRVLVGWGS